MSNHSIQVLGSFLGCVVPKVHNDGFRGMVDKFLIMPTPFNATDYYRMASVGEEVYFDETIGEYTESEVEEVYANIDRLIPRRFSSR